MSTTSSSQDASPASRRRRRRLTAWLAFGVLGIAMGAVWATGFASIGGATGSHVVSPIVAPSTPGGHTSDLATLVTADTPLTVAWADRWGSVAATSMFKVDLSGQPAGNTYNIAFLLTQATTPTGWATLQLKVENENPAGASCAASDFATAGTRPKVMDFDHQDAGVYWNGLAGGAIYCIGLAPSDGQQIAGTFLRAAQATAPTVYPTFITTVDRAS